MYTIIAGGVENRREQRDFRGDRGGRGFSSRSRGGRFGQSRPSSGGARNMKRGFKKDFIDENLFINKSVTAPEVQTYDAKHTFRDFALPTIVHRNLLTMGFDKPSPIQDQSIPVALSGRDVLGIASTGTGKTAAFLLPLIDKLSKNRHEKIMVLTPTRELALQVEKQFHELSRGLRLFSVTCVGGAPLFRQIKKLSLGVQAVIGTPGRVKDLIDRKKLDPAQFRSIVLDEADRMLDMGFIDDMREVLGMMPEDKQTLFFSATLPKSIEALVHDFMKDPFKVVLKTRDTAASVAQDVIRLNGEAAKQEALIKILGKPVADKVLVFRETKRHVDELALALKVKGVKALALHGDMHNRERERAVAALAQGNVQAVIATDVAARGIDIPNISLVINYDIPNNYETYIHRIGRTGRGSNVGHALTFVPAR